MDDLLEKACVHTRLRGSKKLTPGDLYVHSPLHPNLSWSYELSWEKPQPLPDRRKKAINTNPELDWLLDLASKIPESAVEEFAPRASSSTRRQPSANSHSNTNAAPRKRVSKKESVDQAYGYQAELPLTTNPSSLPHIGTWKKDPVGGGGTGEGGRGMFDDYEEDDDDY
jgi:hypothetical protein